MTRPTEHAENCPRYQPTSIDALPALGTRIPIHPSLNRCNCALAERQRIFDLERRVGELEGTEKRLSQVALEAIRVVHCTTHAGEPHIFEPCGTCGIGGTGELRGALTKALGTGYTGLVWGLVDREKWLAALSTASASASRETR